MLIPVRSGQRLSSVSQTTLNWLFCAANYNPVMEGLGEKSNVPRMVTGKLLLLDLSGLIPSFKLSISSSHTLDSLSRDDGMIKRPSEPSSGTPAGPNVQGATSLPDPSVSTITSLRPEFDTLYRLKEQLEANQDTWKAAYSSLGMRLAANVDEYKVFSHGLQARQSQLISEAYDKPLAEQLLGRSERYMFPPLDRLIFSRADSVITCKPNEPEPTESRHDESDPQDGIRYADQATQFPEITPPHTVRTSSSSWFPSHRCLRDVTQLTYRTM